MSFFQKSKITEEQVDLIRGDKLLFSFSVAKINNRFNRQWENRKRGQSVQSVNPKNAKHSVPEAHRFVLKAFRFVQTVQCSRGVVARFRVWSVLFTQATFVQLKLKTVSSVY